MSQLSHETSAVTRQAESASQPRASRVTFDDELKPQGTSQSPQLNASESVLSQIA